MSKTLSIRGILDMGLQDEINLKTLKGKTGYQITKFKIITETPGISAGTGTELVGKIYTRDQTGSIDANVNFSESDLLAVSYNKEGVAASQGGYEVIIFDNEVFNQNIYVTMQDASGNTIRGNYYIELKTMTLSDVQATQLTLKNLRTLASR